MECGRCKNAMDVCNREGRTGQLVCGRCIDVHALYVCCDCHRWWRASDLDATRMDDNHCLDCRKAL